MLNVAVALLGLTALVGLVMGLTRLFSQRRLPTWVTLLHGMLASSTLTLLLYAHFTEGLVSPANVGLLILLVAAGGGGILNLGYHQRGRPLPKWLVVAHGLTAILGASFIVAAWL